MMDVRYNITQKSTVLRVTDRVNALNVRLRDDTYRRYNYVSLMAER